jgi:beta-lactam-binding protein with PASTA domain
VEVYDEETVSGNVVAVYPQVGSDVAVNSKVTLYISRGKGDASVIVRDYVGMTFEEAKNEILKLNLKVAEPIEADSHRPKGEVIHQDPPYGTTILEGDSVLLTISNGIPPAPVEVTVSFNVILPTTAREAVDLTVWIDGVQDATKSLRVDPTLVTSTPISVTGEEGTVISVMIRLNNSDYQLWEIAFEGKGEAIKIRDYGFVVPDEGGTESGEGTEQDPESDNTESDDGESDSSSTNE